MKVCFIWVETFRNFENLGINLSSSFKFIYNQQLNTLSLKEVEPLPNDFFGTNISDVIGIIGKNGAGKSNAVELICKILKGAKTSLQTNFLLITEEKNKLCCYHSFHDNNNKPKADFDITIKPYDGSINPLKVIFFSNVFDERRNDFDKEVSDISVNNLYNKNHLSKRSILTDFEKQIRLINSKIFPSLGIEHPTKVQFLSKVWTNRFNSSMDRFAYGENFDSIKNFKNLFRDRLREIKPENKFIHLMKFGFFFEVIENLSRRTRFRANEFRNLIEGVGPYLSTLTNLKTDEISDKLIEYLELGFESVKLSSEQRSLFNFKEYKGKSTIRKDLFFNQIAFLKDLKSGLEFLDIEYNTEGSRNRSYEYFTFDYKLDRAKAFINDYTALFDQIHFFDINWLGISSGHKAYLNLFASLYQEIRYARQGDLFLCIDEGDLYLHPKWQIEFF